jgi:hypothetical protein
MARKKKKNDFPDAKVYKVYGLNNNPMTKMDQF